MPIKPIPPPLWQNTLDLTAATYPPGGTLLAPTGGGGGGGTVTAVTGTAPIASSGGTAPDISLANSGVTAASYGDATHVGTFTVDAHGLLTAAANVLITGTAPGGTAGGDLSGLYPNPTVFQAHLTDQAVPATPAAGTLVLYGFNQQGFSVPHVQDPQGNAIELVRDNLMVVRNVSGVTLSRGMPVYFTGTTGAVPTVAKAKANSSTTMPAIGIMYDTTASPGYGRMMTSGNIEAIDMSAFSSGNPLFVSAATAGVLTATAPATFPQFIGRVLNNGVGNGVLQVALEEAPQVDWEYASYTAKTTPVAADLMLLADSAASNQLKKITFANVAAGVLATVSAYHRFNLDISTGSQSTKYDSSQKRVLGQIYFDPSNAAWGLTPTSTATFYMVLQTTNAANAAHGDLYFEPTVGSPVIVGTTTTTTSLTAALVSVSVSTYFRSTSSPGVFDARAWVTTFNGNDQCTCTAAWVEITP